MKSFIKLILHLIVLLVFVAVTNSAHLLCYNRSFDDYAVISLEQPLALFKSPCYKFKRNTVVYAFGYEEVVNDNSVRAIVGSYLGRVNILLLDWQKEAGGLMDVSYFLTAVSNAKKVGEKFGTALTILNAAGLDLSTVHLIGFSLGAQLMASTGKEVQKSNLIIERITGLDPAGPLYQCKMVSPQLDRSCANFVDIIHTNPGQLGNSDAVGTVDIWPNCGSSIQPACEENLFQFLTNSSACSHNQVWKYYKEAILNPRAFQVRSASSCHAWKSGKGTDRTIYMGDAIDKHARGNFFCRTRKEPFYGLGEEGSRPSFNDKHHLV